MLLQLLTCGLICERVFEAALRVPALKTETFNIKIGHFGKARRWAS